jgi:actin-like ATPase involved in cell morphogenesis
LIVEMGYERIGFGVATGAGVLVSGGLDLGGYDLDRVLVGALRRRGLTVSFDQARALREGLGFPDSALDTGEDEDELREPDDVLPRHVGPALRPFVLFIADEIREILARTPGEAAEDVLGCGVILCGGAAQTPGVARLMGEDLGVPVTVAPKPATVRVRGLARYLDYPDLLDEVGSEA